MKPRLACALFAGFALGGCGDDGDDRGRPGADRPRVDRLLDRIRTADVESVVLEVPPLREQVLPLSALQDCGVLPPDPDSPEPDPIDREPVPGSFRVLALPVPVELDVEGRPELLELQGSDGGLLERETAAVEVVPALRRVDLRSLESFRGFRRRRNAEGVPMIRVDRPCEVEFDVLRYGGAVRGRLGVFVGPRSLELSELEGNPPRIGLTAEGEWEDERTLGRVALNDILFQLGPSLGPQGLRLEFDGIEEGFGKPRVMLDVLELEQVDGRDRLLVPAAVDLEATRVRFLPGSPRAVISLGQAGGAPRVIHEGAVLPGRAAISVGIPQDFELAVDGELAARTRRATRELGLDVERYDRRRLEVRSAQGLRGRWWLMQPQASFVHLLEPRRTFSPHLPAIRGLEGSARFHPLVRHVRVRDVTRRSLLAPAPTSVLFEVEFDEGDTLEFATAVVGLSGDWPAPKHLVELRAVLEDELGPRVLAEIPGHEEELWKEHRLTLPAPRAERSKLKFETVASGPTKVALQEYVLAVAEPQIVCTARERDRAPPNVLIYLVDTLRADHCSAYGYARETTPVLDALAEEGVLFERAYAQGPWTRPSVASLVTGLLYSLHRAGKNTGLSPELTTLAERMRGRGNDTAAFMANAYVHGPSLNFEQGFDYFVSLDESSGSSRAADVNDLVFPWLEQQAGRPFFLYVHTIDPHATYDPPEATAGTFNKGYEGPLTPEMTHRRTLTQREAYSGEDLQYLLDLYDEEILSNDAELGRLLEHLRRLGLYENTVVVVLSDHGEEFLEHGGFGHGGRLWEELLRVPLVVKGVGPHRPRGVRVADPVRVLDLLPTFADVLDWDAAGAFLGTSLRPWWEGQAPGLLPVIAEEEPGQRCLVEGDRKLIVRAPEGLSEPELMLFDLARDPREQSDLARSDPAAAEALLERLEAVLRSYRERGFKPAETLRPDALTEEEKRALDALGYLDAED